MSDWVKWHRSYDTSSSMKARLELVQSQISSCLIEVLPGPIRVISICAGDGRDIIGTLKNHSRRGDVHVRLIELNAELVEAGRRAAQFNGLVDQIEFFHGDATKSKAYRGSIPAEMVLACGVFGNVRTKHFPHLIGTLCSLCHSGSFLIWTRVLSRDGFQKVEKVRELLQRAAFEEVFCDFSDVANHFIGSHRYIGIPQPLHKRKKLFQFTDRQKIERPNFIVRKILLPCRKAIKKINARDLIN
jgi:hypothetical protein